MDRNQVFELMDLFFAQHYHTSLHLESSATDNLWRHIELHGELVVPISTIGEAREDLLDKKLQASRGVISSGLLWHTWRRSFFRTVP